MALLNRILLSIIFSLAGSIPTTLEATAGEHEYYWQKRGDDARKLAESSFHPNPENITNQLNLKVRMALEGSNSTRRELRKYSGPCMATNPIDRCWRCQPQWAAHRKRLADCALGFGRRAVGGKHGKLYIVTENSDEDLVNPRPGTLRHAVVQEGPLWIVFARSMVIRLSEELIVTSNKTIDGRGRTVHIAHGAGITLQYVNNVIIHGLRIHDIVAGSGGTIRDSATHAGRRTESDGDGISLFGASDIWIDHVSMWNCRDGLVDAVQGSTGITVSNCHFSRHNEVMLLGASGGQEDVDRGMQVTVAFNHFGKGLVQRMPRCRWGFIHVINNDYTHWLKYAIGGSHQPTIISHGNRFIAPPDQNAKEVTKRDYATEEEWSRWTWKSENDVMMNGAFFRESGGGAVANGPSNQEMVPAMPGTFVSRLTRFAGALDCTYKQPC